MKRSKGQRCITPPYAAIPKTNQEDCEYQRIPYKKSGV